MRIEASLIKELCTEARLAAPLECCGVLWRRPKEPVTQRSSYPGPLFSDRFQLEPRWLLSCLYRARERGLRAAGFYHSHPRAESLCPSRRDLEGHPPGSICLLLSGAGERPRAFRLSYACDIVEEVKIEPV